MGHTLRGAGQMDWQVKIGLGLAIVFGLLPYVVKEMPDWVSWPGLALGIAFIGWGLFPNHDHFPRGPTALLLISIALMVGAIAWFKDSGFVPPPVAAAVAALPASPPPASPALIPRPEVSRAQFEELMRLSEFIGADENKLRQTFDVMGILKRNIYIQTIRIKLRASGRQGFDYNHYADGDGSIIWLAMEGKYHFTPSGPYVDEGPHDVLFLITSAKYQVAQRQLSDFLNSPLIPEAVKLPLTEYRKVVNENFELMIRTLNKYMNQSDDFFLKADEQGGPFYAAINNGYFSKFTNLKPKADEVAKQIARYLGTS